MKKQRVLLVCSQQLFGESIKAILRQIGSMNLLGPLELSNETICSQLPVLRPDAVIIAEGTPNSAAASLLTIEILQNWMLSMETCAARWNGQDKPAPKHAWRCAGDCSPGCPGAA